MSKILNYLKANLKRWLPGAVISIIALIVVFKLADFQELGAAFAAIRPISIILMLAFTFASLFTKSMAWRSLLGNKPTVKETFFIVNEGYFLNNILPLRAGEIGRAVFMGQASGQGTFHALSTIVIERAFDVAIAAVLLMSTLPLTLGMEGGQSIAITSLLIIIAIFVILFLMARYNEQVKNFAARLGKRWPFVERVILPQLDSLLDGLSVLTKPSQFFRSLFWILLTWALWVGIYYSMLLSFDMHAPLWWGAFVDSFLALGMAVPSAPAGLGVYEASLLWAMSMLGIPNSEALAYAIALHFLQFLITAIFGLIGLIRQGHSISSLFGGMKEQPSQE